MFNEGLEKIGKAAFTGCCYLESIILPSTLTEIGVQCHLESQGAFSGCTNLREVLLNEGLRKIGEYAFASCTSLQCIRLPSTLIEINNYAFKDCTNLREIELQERLPTIENRSFANCFLLERFKFPSLSTRLEAIVHCQTQVENKIDEVCGQIERNGAELFISAAAMGVHSHITWDERVAINWNTAKQNLTQIVSWIRFYEIKETTPLFELALWKENMNQSGATNISKREAYRIEVPGPVKDAILQYLFD